LYHLRSAVYDGHEHCSLLSVKAGQCWN
jgi:hypothetical protein